MAAQKSEPLAGPRKAAILLVLLGDDAATSIYRSLPEHQVRVITEQIAELDFVAPETAGIVLEEYHKLTLTQDFVAQGGHEQASKLLVKAFGEQGAKDVLDQANRAQEASQQNLDTLQKTDPQQLAKFIQG